MGALHARPYTAYSDQIGQVAMMRAASGTQQENKRRCVVPSGVKQHCCCGTNGSFVVNALRLEQIVPTTYKLSTARDSVRLLFAYTTTRESVMASTAHLVHCLDIA
eukprot:COSAG02_NODE_118_length_35376_cov_20.294923_20_plen_106_part_00